MSNASLDRLYKRYNVRQCNICRSCTRIEDYYDTNETLTAEQTLALIELLSLVSINLTLIQSHEDKTWCLFTKGLQSGTSSFDKETLKDCVIYTTYQIYDQLEPEQVKQIQEILR